MKFCMVCPKHDGGLSLGCFARMLGTGALKFGQPVLTSIFIIINMKFFVAI